MYHQRELTGFELTGNFRQQIPGNVSEIGQTVILFHRFSVSPAPPPNHPAKKKKKKKSVFF